MEWGRTLGLVSVGSDSWYWSSSMQDQFPTSPPAVGEVSKAISGIFIDHSLPGISALGSVCSLLLEVNVKVPLDSPNLILCCWASISILFLKTVLLSGECSYICDCPSEHTLKSSPQTWSNMFTAKQLTREDLLWVRRHFWVLWGPMLTKWLFLRLLWNKSYFNVVCISPFLVGPHIGRYCGQKTPGRIRSSSGILSMVFYTDSAIAKEGFSANYSVLQSSVSEGQYLFILQSTVGNTPYSSSSHPLWPQETLKKYLVNWSA